MKARIVHSKFYESERVLNLSLHARWLFMYYLTCSGIGLTGAFKWGDSKTLFETGLDTKGLAKAKDELQSSKLVLFYDGWVIVPQTEEKTGYSQGGRTSKAYEEELSHLPDRVSSLLNTLYENDDRVSALNDTPINHKSEIINQRQGESAERGISAAAITPGEMQAIADSYGVPLAFVESKHDDLVNWCKAKGKRYKNYVSALRDWVKKDAMKLKKEAKNERPTLVVIPGAS